MKKEHQQTSIIAFYRFLSIRKAPPVQCNRKSLCSCINLHSLCPIDFLLIASAILTKDVFYSDFSTEEGDCTSFQLKQTGLVASLSVPLCDETTDAFFCLSLFEDIGTFFRLHFVTLIQSKGFEIVPLQMFGTQD